MKTGQFFSTLFIISASCALFSCRQTQSSRPEDNFTATQIGKVTDYAVSEISGLARSQVNKNALWMINDSGDGPNIYALAQTGELLTSIKIDGADNIDWEDLALFSFKGVNYLLIADTGGNTSHRDVFDIYIIREPNLQQTPKSVNVQWAIHFRYEDKARDCEAVAVDALTENIYLLSKRSTPPVLYELPLRPDGDGVILAKKLGEINTIPQPAIDDIKERYDEYQSQPTGLDAAAGGKQIAVLTYRRLFLYNRAENESWIEALNRTPLQIEYPRLKQAEAVCFYDNGPAVLVTSEQIPAPIIKVEPKAER